MRMDQLVSDTFAEHEHLAPVPDEVMAGVQAQLDHPRAGGWPMTLAVAATVVAVVAGTAWAVRSLPSHNGQQTTAQTRSTVPAASSSRPAAPITAARTIAPLTMPFDLGWLPAGSKQYLARRINVGGTSMTSAPVFDGEYLLQVGALDLDIQQMPGDLAGVMFKSGSGAATTINGRPAVESSNSAGPGGYEVYFIDSSGRLMYVNASAKDGATAPPNQLITVGRQVAAGVHYPGRTQVVPTFGLGYVPAGSKIRAFDVSFDVFGSGAVTTSYDVGTSTSQDSTVNVLSGPASAPSGAAGRTVQGHPTRYNVDHGFTSFYVLNAVGGGPVLIEGRLSLSEFYRIADGLVLPR